MSTTPTASGFNWLLSAMFISAAWLLSCAALAADEYTLFVNALVWDGTAEQRVGPTRVLVQRNGVIETGAYADIILVRGNPLEDLRVLGAEPSMFKASARGEGIDSIPLVMKDGIVYRDTL